MGRAGPSSAGGPAWGGVLVVVRARESRVHGEGGQRSSQRGIVGLETSVNSGELWPDFDEAWAQVRRMQAKLHLWATRDPGRVFNDLYNLVYDPAFLVHAWERVRGNRGGRTAGVDGIAPVDLPRNATRFLAGLRAELKDRTFRPQQVRERMIPKPGTT